MLKKSKALIQILLLLVIICAMLMLLLMKQNQTARQDIAVLQTSKGNIEITLDYEHAPVTADNFARYVKEGHYDGFVFHRVIKGFMIQGGGFTAKGEIKSTYPPIILESNNGLSNKAGTIAMARNENPDSATDQFFINTKDNTYLDYNLSRTAGYAVFGKVTAGMDVVRAIESVPTGTRVVYDNWPLSDIVIVKAFMKK
jgi:cyclophilin family peptidyl-prolyl cis-trans isomerase